MDMYQTIRNKIGAAQQHSPLAARNITLLGASKGQTAATIELFIKAGLCDFGENRVQEAQEKWLPLKKAHPFVTLHMIGPLQTNKVKEALDLFDVIQTLDRPKLAEAIARHENQHKKRFYIQVNTGEEHQKAGASPKETNDFIRYCRELGLNIVGLMCVPPANEMPAPHFALLRKLAMNNNLHALSMGMSGDYQTAVRMGSTCVRVGTALFGARP